MSKHFRQEFERMSNVVDLATGQRQSDKEPVRVAKPIEYNWVPVVHGHSKQGRSDAAKLGWQRRKERQRHNAHAPGSLDDQGIFLGDYEA